MSKTIEVAKKSKEASIAFSEFTESDRIQSLENLAKRLKEKTSEILSENKKDIDEAKEENLSEALIDRLQLTKNRIQDMIDGVLSIAQQDQVVGEIVSSQTREDGLVIQRERIPLGVIAMIFESRPNVVIDCAALAIKSGNAIILKGGKEAKHSNLVLSRIVRESIKDFIPENIVQLVETREDIDQLLELNKFIDLMIPRGGAKLIEYVYEHAKMPVVAHFAGLCHGYIHSDAQLSQAKSICLNAKAQRPGVCNAMETLLLHKDLPKEFLLDLFQAFLDLNVELRVDEALLPLNPKLKPATPDDWSTEYLDKILSVKQVSGIDEAIKHIQKYGTHHTEFICTEDKKVAKKFQQQVDASCIMVNASSRFNDGGQLGLGAELGISTSKIHAYGPMGAREMTTTRFVVLGQGHIRE